MVYDAFSIPVNTAIAGANAAAKLRGYGNSVPYVKNAAARISEGLTSLGLPNPESVGEQRQAAITQGAAGVAGGLGLGGSLQQVPNAQKLAALLTSRPTAQVVAGSSGAVGSQIAREALPQDTNPLVRFLVETGAGVAGSMTPQAVTATARRVATPVRATLTPEEIRLTQAAKAAGVELSVGQQTGSVPLQTAERVLGRLPFSSGMQQRQFQGQREAFNTAVLKPAGIKANNAAPNVLQDAFKTQGNRFNTLAANTTVKIDAPFWQQMDDTVTQYGRRLPTDQKPVFQSYVDDINVMRNTNNPQIAGKEYQTIASDLRTASRAARGANPALSTALDGLVKTLDDVMGRSMGPQLAGDWKSARAQYRNLLQVDDAMSKGTAIDRTKGNIPLSSFNQTVKSFDPSGYSRGRGGYNDLARVGSFLANKIPDSGTAANTQMQNWLTGGATAGGVGLAAVSPPAAAAAATALALPPTIAGVMNSRLGRAYLTNKAFAGPNPAAVDPKALAIMLLQQQNNQR